MKQYVLAGLLAVGFTSFSGAALADPALKAAISSPARNADNVKRDQFRHPYETLTFFGIKPNMTVVELSPGGGWYTEILAPYLRDQGKLIAAGTTNGAEGFQKFLAKDPGRDKVVYGTFMPGKGMYNYAPKGSADMVLTFRNIHNWIGIGDDGMKKMMANIYDSLKPGGVFGVEEHRLPASMKQDAEASSGYVHEAYVIKMAEQAGFKLVAKSEVNANSKDDANHENGVWALPPTYTNKDKDRAKYAAIGESDRMTLKFVKPQ